MPKLTFDTRFFVEYFYSTNRGLIEKAKNLVTRNKERFVSPLTIHETYLLSLRKEGRETAHMRLQVILAKRTSKRGALLAAKLGTFTRSKIENTTVNMTM